MKIKFFLITTLVLILSTTTYTSIFAQSKDELNELLNAEPAGKTKGKAEKQKAEPKAKAEKAAKPEKVKEEKATNTEKAKEEKPVKESLAKEPQPKQETSEKAAKSPKAKTEKTPKATSAKSTSTVSGNGKRLKELPSTESIGWRKCKKIGNQLFTQGSIYNGLNYYEAALAKKPKKTFLNQYLADGNFAVRDYATANKYYKTLVALDAEKQKNPMAIYQSALTDKYLGNYEAAKESFLKFKSTAAKTESLNELRGAAVREIQGCDLAMQQMANLDMPEYKVERLNENINQPLTDFAPIHKDDNTIYYGSWTSDEVALDGKREKYTTFSRIYTAKRQVNGWTKGEMLNGALNEVSAHTGNPALTPDGQTMFYTQCLQDETGAMRCNIYKSNLGNGTWSTGEKLDASVNKEGTHNTQPAVGRNEAGDLGLYFASDRNPARGLDIYFAKLNANGSVEAAKQVAGINTRGDEMTPSYDFKNNTLYFSSNGQVNIGGADVFKTSLKNGEWSEPQNLGLPINSSVDDMYFNWDEKTGEGFVVSNRPGGAGLRSPTCCDDIYAVQKTKLFFAVKGLLQNADDNYKTISDGLVQLYDDKSGKELKAVYATDGSYFFDLEKETAYKIIGRKKGFEDMILSVSTVGKRSNDTMTLDFTLKSIPGLASHIGETIGTVYWEFNADRLSAGAPDTLNQVTQFMVDNPNTVLEVGSHTDAKGSDAYNLALSQRRSDAVLKYLLSKKIRKFRLVSKAYGESMPAALNEDPEGVDNPAGRDLNRRTEFKIIGEMSADEITAAEAAEMDAKKGKTSSAIKPKK